MPLHFGRISPPVRAAVVLDASYKNWILEAIPVHASQAINEKVKLIWKYSSRRELLIPRVFASLFRRKTYPITLYMHHKLFLKYVPLPEKSGHNHLWITHFEENENFTSDEIEKLKLVNRFIVHNHFVKAKIHNFGIPLEKIFVGVGGVDRKLFFPSENPPADDYILIVGDCKPRKRPDLVEEIIASSPELNFVIHGKNWESMIFTSRTVPANLKLLPFNLGNAPELIRNASALLSLSELEGGPFPVIEALVSGTPVVATETGIAPDILTTQNGYLLSKNPEIEEIRNAITFCLKLKKSMYSSDLLGGKYEWNELGHLLFDPNIEISN